MEQGVREAKRTCQAGLYPFPLLGQLWVPRILNFMSWLPGSGWVLPESKPHCQGRFIGLKGGKGSCSQGWENRVNVQAME